MLLVDNLKLSLRHAYSNFTEYHIGTQKLFIMQLPEIKQRLKIQTVLNHYGLKTNRNNMLNCPFPASAGASAGKHEDSNSGR